MKRITISGALVDKGRLLLPKMMPGGGLSGRFTARVLVSGWKEETNLDRLFPHCY
jgi:hypothetical protein